jgi:hypothetical protein
LIGGISFGRQGAAMRTAHVRPRILNRAIAPLLALLVGLILTLSHGDVVRAQAGVQGRWQQLSYTMPINPVHIALLNTGKVLIVAGSGNVATETNWQSAVWDWQAGTFSTQPVAWDMFCNGMVVLPDGRVFVNGGTVQYDPFYGSRRSSAYDPATGVFSDLPLMAHGRWYPTVTVLGDGRVLTFSGRDIAATNATVEIYTPGPGGGSWSPEYPALWTPPLYPRLHLVTDGRVFYSGSGAGSRFFNPSTNTWSLAAVATTKYGSSRTYGTSVLLPLNPEDGYRSRVMIFGGGNPATDTTEIIDLSAALPQWNFGPPMTQKRIQMNATILPNGKILAMGGSVNNEDAATKSLNADLYDPATNTFSSAGANQFARLYHSGSLLLPDATVALVGGNPTRGSYESRIEIYSPAYLFQADGTPAPRPTITGVTPEPIGYGQTFEVQTPDAAAVQSVVLVRPGAQTHAIDMDQRLVRTQFTRGTGTLSVIAPPTGNVAPPGYYMLFILNSSGVPSLAKFVQLTQGGNQAPTATINTPSANITMNPGESSVFAGSGNDPDGTISGYSWTFPTGNPSSGVQASANVTFSTPGTHTVSFRVTDDDGATSAAATRSVTVADFSVSATPASQTVMPGSSTSYSVTVAPQNGFTGTVGLSATGLPSGAGASFSPATVAGSGTSTLTIATNGTLPPGNYPFVITGTSGPVSHSVNVTLVVAGFTVSATPTSRTVAAGASTTYAVTVAALNGFNGTVGLSATGLPSGASGSFSPATVAGSGTSTLTIVTNATLARGTYPLVITGTSGSVSHSTNVTLVVNGDFTVTASPPAATINVGGDTNYSVQITSDGFSGTVAFTVSGLPKFASAKFTPTTIVNGGTTVLTISTNRKVARGAYQLTIRASSGSLAPTTTVGLTIQ